MPIAQFHAMQDGTLTVPCIDFALMRRRVGVLNGDILEEIAKMAPEAQARARAAIWDVEQQVCSLPRYPQLQLAEGCACSSGRGGSE
jgi:hypothetical protein